MTLTSAAEIRRPTSPEVSLAVLLRIMAGSNDARTCRISDIARTAFACGRDRASSARYGREIALFQDFAMVQLVSGNDESQSAHGDFVFVGDSTT
jgi:hypothetical protein